MRLPWKFTRWDYAMFDYGAFGPPYGPFGTWRDLLLHACYYLIHSTFVDKCYDPWTAFGAYLDEWRLDRSPPPRDED